MEQYTDLQNIALWGIRDLPKVAKVLDLNSRNRIQVS